MSGEQNTRARGQRKTVEGYVVSDKMDKTITVRSERLVKHPLYGKYIRRATIAKAHDENNEAQQGDLVEIAFTRPLSKTKNWRLVKIVRRSTLAGPVPVEDEVAEVVEAAAPESPAPDAEAEGEESSS